MLIAVAFFITAASDGGGALMVSWISISTFEKE
jgi:hypothetical protein